MSKASPLNDLLNSASFLGRFLNDPSSVGAVVPSSKQLARRMASYLPQVRDEWIVELGAGTGVVTAAIAKHITDYNRFLAIDLCPKMVGSIQRQLPHIKVAQGDATRLDELLSHHSSNPSPRVQAIVSSLPLRSLPSEVVTKILSQIERLLAKDGVLIQFTYDIRTRIGIAPKGFVRSNTSVVWFNIPPARVEVFRRGNHSIRGY
jgi:phospholipid N-methyltransferase